MPESRFLSDSIENVLLSLSADTRPEGSAGFPNAVTNETLAQLRCGQTEDVRGWFVRCVDTFAEKDPGSCALEENLAVFAYVRWRRDRQLVYANISVLCTECTLHEYYLDEAAPAACQYLRLDLDYDTLWPVLTHPLPHIHAVSGEPAARFELGNGASPNIVLDFFEIVYRQLQPDKWLQWAQRIWTPWFGQRFDEMSNPLERIILAFRENDIATLRMQRDYLEQMRRLVRGRLNELSAPFPKGVFDLLVSASDRDLLTSVL